MTRSKKSSAESQHRRSAIRRDARRRCGGCADQVSAKADCAEFAVGLFAELIELPSRSRFEAGHRANGGPASIISDFMLDFRLLLADWGASQ